MVISHAQHHKGSALITALFIVALIATLTTAATLRIQRNIYYTHTSIEHTRLYSASQLVTFWAIQTLHNNERHIAFPKVLSKIYPNIFITGDLVNLTLWEKDHTKDAHIFLPHSFKILRLANSAAGDPQDYLCVATASTIEGNTLTTYTLIRRINQQTKPPLIQIIGIVTA